MILQYSNPKTPPLEPCNGYGVSWVLVGFFVFVSLRLALLSPEMLGDPDTFLHVAIGDWIRAHQTVPLTDPFSYPMAGQPWVAHEWLSGLLMSYAYSVAGWYGVCVLSVVSLGLTLVILARFLLRHLPPAYAILLVVLAFAGLESHLLARPHVMAWPIMALWISLLMLRSEAGRLPPFWLLPFMVLWANLHGSFTLGLAFVVPLGLESCWNQRTAWRKLAIGWFLFLVLAIACSLLTPFGWHGLAFTNHLVSIEALATITEWQPLNVKGHPLVLMWAGLLLVLGLRGWLTISWIRLALLLGLGWQMMLHARFYSVFAMLVPLIIAAPLALSMRGWPLAKLAPTRVDVLLERWSLPSKNAAVLVALLALMVPIALLQQPNLEPGPKHAPRAAVNFIKQFYEKQHGINFYNYGGYLIWSGIPVFMDGRIDLRGDAGMKAYDEALTKIESVGLGALLGQYDIQWSLFPKANIGRLHMDEQSGWLRVYEDDEAVVHARVNK